MWEIMEDFLYNFMLFNVLLFSNVFNAFKCVRGGVRKELEQDSTSLNVRRKWQGNDKEMGRTWQGNCNEITRKWQGNIKKMVRKRQGNDKDMARKW